MIWSYSSSSCARGILTENPDKSVASTLLSGSPGATVIFSLATGSSSSASPRVVEMGTPVEAMVSVSATSERGASFDLTASVGLELVLREGEDEEMARELAADDMDLGMEGVGGRRADVSAEEMREINVALAVLVNSLPYG